jgi:hypothetical protein
MDRKRKIQEILDDPVQDSTPRFSLRNAIRDITGDTKPIQFGEGHHQNVAQAQRSYIKKAQMNDQFKTAETYASTLNEDEKRTQKKTIQDFDKRVRTDKKRHKRNQVNESESWLNQAMQVIPPPVRTSDDLLRRADIGFIGNVPPENIQRDADGFYIDSTRSSSSSNVSVMHPAEPDEDFRTDLPLVLQKYFISHPGSASGSVAESSSTHSISVPPPLMPNGDYELQPIASTHHNVCERHLQAMSNKGGQYSFIINLLMHERQCNVPIEMLPEVDTYLADIRDISRSEEESFLRQPIPGRHERECVEGENCEGFHVTHAYVRFALVEYQPPEIREEFQRTRKWPEKQGMCIMCRRKYANFVFFNILSRCTSYDHSSIEQAASTRNMTEASAASKPLMISSFANFVGQGEYSPWDIQISGISQYVPLFKPVVLHLRYKYRQEKRNGIWYFVQNYYKPQRNLRFGGGQVYEESS